MEDTIGGVVANPGREDTTNETNARVNLFKVQF